jgi:hypothetical protein
MYEEFAIDLDEFEPILAGLIQKEVNRLSIPGDTQDLDRDARLVRIVSRRPVDEAVVEDQGVARIHRDRSQVMIDQFLLEIGEETW